jgi:hypothetical protein
MLVLRFKRNSPLRRTRFLGGTDCFAQPAGNFSIVGWYLHDPTAATEVGFSGNQRMRIGAGTANTGACMSFGASGSTERALGMLNSNTMTATAGADAYYGARFDNDTGRRLVSMAGWRRCHAQHTVDPV